MSRVSQPEPIMVNLTRPEGSKPEDFRLSRRGLAGLFFAGYAAAAFSAKADPIHTDEAGLDTDMVMIQAADRQIPAYVARPASSARAPFPAVIVVSEVFGVHEYIRDLCRRLAKLGYVAIAPAFFHRAGDPAALTEMKDIQKIVVTATNEQVMSDVGATLAWLKAQAFVDRKRLALTGFCWGGGVAWMAATRFKELKATTAWYGRLSKPAPGGMGADEARAWPVEVVGQLKAPVLGLYGGKDMGIPQSDVEAMRAALKARRKPGELVVYPQAQHGFHADYRPSYDEAAAKDGWARMLAHFARYGAGPGAG
jgi:carboxymethylenebutenolidase